MKVPCYSFWERSKGVASADQYFSGVKVPLAKSPPGPTLLRQCQRKLAELSASFLEILSICNLNCIHCKPNSLRNLMQTENSVDKRESKTLSELKKGVANSIRSIRIKTFSGSEITGKNSWPGGLYWDLQELKNPQKSIIVRTDSWNTRIMMDLCGSFQGKSSEVAWSPEIPDTMHPVKKSPKHASQICEQLKMLRFAIWSTKCRMGALTTEKEVQGPLWSKLVRTLRPRAHPMRTHPKADSGWVFAVSLPFAPWSGCLAVSDRCQNHLCLSIRSWPFNPWCLGKEVRIPRKWTREQKRTKKHGNHKRN